MLGRIKQIFYIISVLCIFAPFWASARPFVVGSISYEPSAEIAIFLPFAQYLATKLAPFGITEGKVLIARDIPQMAEWLKQGRVDLYIGGPIAAEAASQLAGSHLLLRRWKMGIKQLKSVIFVRSDSEIKRLEDLLGKTIAFETSFSSVSYLLPKLILIHHGFRVVQKISFTGTVPPNEIGFVFSGDAENTSAWVARRLVDAGAMGWPRFQQFYAESPVKLRVIYTSFPVPKEVVSVRGDLNPLLIAALRNILLQMNETEEGRKVLRDFQHTSKFDDIPPETLQNLSKLNKAIHVQFNSE
jgi:phosphonate transport system substrate-binding protein